MGLTIHPNKTKILSSESSMNPDTKRYMKIGVLDIKIQRWQKKKGMGKYLSDHDHDCLTNLRFADDVMLFATSKEHIRTVMCDFKKATEKVVLRIHPDKTKILSNQSTINSDTKGF